MMWMVKKKKKIIGTKRTRKSSLTNLNQRPVDNDNTNMMQWSFDLHAKNPSLSVDIDGVSLQWNMNRTWGLCRGSCYFNHGIGFYEVVKKKENLSKLSWEYVEKMWIVVRIYCRMILMVRRFLDFGLLKK